MLDTLDLNMIGLTLNVVGIFFLASSIKFKRIRRVIQAYFGVEKAFPLKEIRQHVVRKIQVYFGFIFLFLGYAFQITSIVADSVSRNETSVIKPNLLTVATILLFSIALMTLILKVVEIGWTRITFKRLLIDFFRHNEWELVRNTEVAKEMGELLKIPRNKDDSIEDYVLKIKKALHIETLSNGSAAPPRRDRPEVAARKAAKIGGESVHPATPPRIS